MKISFESPLSLLHDSIMYNDYQYVLPHLIDEYSTYKDFMLTYRNRTKDSFIIMDNGLFEGITHTKSDLLEKINLIRPDIFIVPDEWNDSYATIRNAKEWLQHKNIISEATNLMVVCQGKTLGELITTYQTLLDLGYKHIAFNHSSIAYKTMFPDYEPLKAQMYGRMEFIRQLVVKNIIDKSVYHHILGASDWKEYMAYNDWEFIKSGDTSAPIINGALGIKFDVEKPYIKPSNKIEEFFKKDFDTQEKEIIFHNIKVFKNSFNRA